jgi:hypothetical protein
VTLPTTTELLLAWDAQRPRSQQVEMGMSKLGSCRRQAGYHLQGVPQDGGYEASGIQNVLGTAIHETAASAARMFLPQAHTESLEVRFGGLVGHPDLFADGVVRDIKTVGYAMQLEQRRRLGPPLRERYQVHTYGAGLVMQGLEVHTVQIDYIDRGSGDEYLFTEPFSVEVVSEAMAWLDDVRTAEITALPRDYRPDSAFCQHCPWFERCWETPRGSDSRAVLFTDDPDAAAWAMQLDSARAMRKLAEERIADAQGALDALRSVSRPGESEDIEVPGLDKLIRFRVNKPKTSPDMATIAVDYARAGARPPFKVGEPVVNVTLVKRKEEQ